MPRDTKKLALAILSPDGGEDDHKEDRVDPTEEMSKDLLETIEKGDHEAFGMILKSFVKYCMKKDMNNDY